MSTIGGLQNHKDLIQKEMMVDQATPYLTKSKYIAGLQCLLRLWKQVYTPLPYQEYKPGTPQYEGTRIGELARTYFPGGVLVDNEAYDHKGALARTKALLAEGCPAIFEGAFEHDNRRIRVDILKHAGEGKWALYEVKSSTSIHDEHFDDAAFQADVLRRSGIDIESVFIIHVKRKYQLGPNGVDVTKFFEPVDISEQLAAQYKMLKPNLAKMTDTLGSTEPPIVAPGLHCWKPHTCEFLEQCIKTLPKDWIGHLPRVSQSQIDELTVIGVSSMSDIPDNVRLQGTQNTVRAAHRTGLPFVSSYIQELLRPLGPPAFYLDFESMMPGIPLYTGTGPYQHIPFLFSLHRCESGLVTHSDYIAPPGPDPRRAFAEKLIRQTSAANVPIIVYSHYEKRIINELARKFPELAPELHKVVARLQDLLEIVRKAVYLPAFNGAYSIKDVSPVLASDVTYSDLAIQDGSKAAAEYQRLVEQRGMLPADTAKTLSNLQAYCNRDTYATVRVHQALIELAEKSANKGRS